MKKHTVFLFIFSLVFIFSGCEKSKDKRTFTQIRTDLISDSIVEMDSLAAILVVRDYPIRGLAWGMFS